LLRASPEADLAVGRELAACGVHEGQPDLVALLGRELGQITEDGGEGVVPGQEVVAAPQHVGRVGAEVGDQPLHRGRDALGARAPRAEPARRDRARSGGHAIVAVQGVPPSESGLASGLLNSARLMGGALGLAALSTVAASSTYAALAAGSGPAHALTDGYGSALRAGAIVCVLGAAVAAAVITPPARVANQAPAAAVERA
jgi:hypothetical protein